MSRSRIAERRGALLGLALGLALAGAAPARAEEPQEPHEPPASEPSRSAEVEDELAPGFGQDPDEKPRIPRIRLEGAFQSIWFESRAKNGHRGTANTIKPHQDLEVPNQAFAARATVVLKLHRVVAIGAEYRFFDSDGPAPILRRRVAYGLAILPPGQRAFGKIEVMQGDLDIRIVAADNARFRAEYFAGMAWISFRLGIHPQPPFLQASPDTRMVQGDSKREEDYFGPTLGLFFAWNFHDRIAVFLENRSAYICPARFGSYASWIRAGFRFRIRDGLEIVLAGSWESGQILEIRDAGFFGKRASGHIFRSAAWFGGGPEIGLSFTY